MKWIFKLTSRIILGLPLLAALLLQPSPAAAEVQAKLFQESGNRFELVIDIGGPAPPTVIVLITLPRGINIQDAEPPPDKFEARHHTAKWLLRGLEAGRTRLTLTTTRSLPLESLTASVRYRDRSSGTVAEIEAVKSKR